MTSSSEPGSGSLANSSPDPLPPWQRLLALSGVAFAVLLVFGWFLSGGDAPDYTATDEDWTNWAGDNRLRSGIGAFLVLLAGIALLHFAGTIRSALGSAETTVPGSVQLARMAFAGAVVGAAGIATAIMMVGAATSEGAESQTVKHPGHTEVKDQLSLGSWLSCLTCHRPVDASMFQALRSGRCGVISGARTARWVAVRGSGTGAACGGNC
jgi:hypothetical protein